MASKNGQLTFNFALSVPADKAAEVEAMIATHAQWMRETHSLIAKPDPTYGMLGTLVDYYNSKAPEMKNPLDPSEGNTGNLIYTLNEVYTRPEGTEAHMEAAPSWKSFEKFLELVE